MTLVVSPKLLGLLAQSLGDVGLLRPWLRQNGGERQKRTSGAMKTVRDEPKSTCLYPVGTALVPWRSLGQAQEGWALVVTLSSLPPQASQ
jgi:hypothetical protein